MPYPLTLNLGVLSLNPDFRDPRTKRTISFFAAKGFISNDIWGRPYARRLLLADVLWTCEMVIPDLSEIVPAAVLRFPQHVPGTPPAELRAVLEALRADATEGPDYKCHPYEYVRQWTSFGTADRRVAPTFLRRATFRLPVALTAGLRAFARDRGATQTAVITAALERYLKA